MSYANIVMYSLSVFLLFASPARAASVSVNSTGNPAVFSVEGTGMDGVAGIQLDITYDAASLAIPTTTQGELVSGALFAAHSPHPGLIKIAVISSRPFSGSGRIALISFASKTGNSAIPSITDQTIEMEGSSLPTTTVSGTQTNDTAEPGTVPTPEIQSSQTSGVSQGRQPGTTSIPTYLGTVTLPTDQQQHVDEQPAPSPTAPPSAGEPEPATAGAAEQTQPHVAPAADAKIEETMQYVVYNGIADRFKQYHGNKDLSAMARLFDKKVAQTVRQEPSILLSDGQSRAVLTIDIPARIPSSPGFAANGGTLVSFKQDGQSKGRWTVEVLPEAGAVRVSVTISAGVEEFEYPLTVAPPAKTALTLDESGWNRFLKEVGTAAAPLHDLNNDGVRDYMDEFIFVANHLAGKSTQVKPDAPSR